MMARITAVGVAILAILGGLASLIALLQWCDVGPPEIAQPRSTFELTEDMLDFSNTLRMTDTGPFEEVTAGMEESCRQGRFDVAEMKCWITLGQLHAAENSNRRALADFDRAQEIDPKIADPYYARGNIYYGLALMDLLRKRRFEMSAEELVFSVRPDDDSRLLFEKTIDEYDRAEGLTTIQELNPSDTIIVTSFNRIAHRRRQMGSFFEGSDTITLHRVELLQGITLLMSMYPDDESLLSDTSLMFQTIMACISAHPEDFPGFIPEVYDFGGSVDAECPNGPTPTPAPEPTISSDFTTYTDEEQLFSISYPSDWELALSDFPRAEEDVRELLRLKESDSPLEYVVHIFAARVPDEASILVGVDPTDASTLDELAELRARDREVRELKCTDFAEVEALAGDRRALIFESECEMEDGGKFRGVEMFVIDGKMVWVVTCGSLLEKFASVKDTCNQAVRSLRILR